MTVWVVRGGRKGDREEAILQSDFVAIGWNELPDLSPIDDRETLRSVYRKAISNKTDEQVSNHVGQVWAFRKLIEPGDIVVLPRLLKARRTEVAIGKVIGPYRYRSDQRDDLHHTCPVQWLCRGIARIKFEQDLQKKFNLQPTVYQIRLENADSRIQAVLEREDSRPPETTRGEARRAWEHASGSLSEVLATVKATIAQYREPGKDLNEENTKTALINPVLCALGWRVGNPDEVYQEFQGADYALFIERDIKHPIMLVEAKALGENLDQPKYAKQVMGYTGTLGNEWAVLTNADEYRIYNATGGAMDLDERLFRKVRVSDPDRRAEEMLALLSKQEICNLQTVWENALRDRRVEEAISTFSPKELHRWLVRSIMKQAGNLKAKAVEASLSRKCPFRSPAVCGGSCQPFQLSPPPTTTTSIMEPGDGRTKTP